MIGSMNDEILNIEELSINLIGILKREYGGVLEKRYGVSEEYDDVKVLEEIAKSRNCYKKGEELDLPKASAILTDDFRSGRIGRITLERPEGNEVE